MYTGFGDTDPLRNTAYALTVYTPGLGDELLDDAGQSILITLFISLLDAVQYVSFKYTKQPTDSEQERKVQLALQ